MSASAAKANTSPEAVLSVESLACYFGGVKAVDECTFSVRPGTITGLMGPNGAGKSTALAVISGFINATSGRVHYDGEDVTHLKPHLRARKRLVRTFQLSSEFADLTVMENMLAGEMRMRGEGVAGAFFGPLYWRSNERRAVARAREVLEKIDLIDQQDELAGRLSGGQKRILEVGRALMAQPRCLLLDEPMAGIHSLAIDKIAGLLETIREDGITVLMAEHELGAIERLCNPVIVMAQGRVISEGTLQEVRGRKEVIDAYLVR
jgi:ABC-type branched-subunit amino acid transport system ATPase component